MRYMEAGFGRTVRVVFIGRNRTIPKRLLWYILSFGISRRIWLYRVNKEVDGHEDLALRHGWYIFLLCLPVVGPSIMNLLTAKHVSSMTKGTVQYGSPALLYAATWIPILGNGFFIAWTQTRLNQYWLDERKHPEHGVDIDLDLDKDPAFRIELAKAVEESYHAGSRFDRRRRRKRERSARAKARRAEIHAQREAIRAMGGSTPLLWWRLARRPSREKLKITCGRCEHEFHLERDPLAATPIVCPSCGLTEVLPSIRGDTLAAPEQALVPKLAAKCPDCKTDFHIVRNLHGPTPMVCPNCGKSDVLDAGPRVLPATKSAGKTSAKKRARA